MSDHPTSRATERELAFGALALAWSFYLAFFLLPVTPGAVGPGINPLTGRQALPVCFLCPGLWTVALGHLLFWLGSLMLAFGRWHWAMLAGLFALTASGVLAMALGSFCVGTLCSLLAMAALCLAGAAGVWLQETAC